MKISQNCWQCGFIFLMVFKTRWGETFLTVTLRNLLCNRLWKLKHVNIFLVECLEIFHDLSRSFNQNKRCQPWSPLSPQCQWKQPLFIRRQLQSWLFRIFHWSPFLHVLPGVRERACFFPTGVGQSSSFPFILLARCSVSIKKFPL